VAGCATPRVDTGTVPPGRSLMAGWILERKLRNGAMVYDIGYRVNGRVVKRKGGTTRREAEAALVLALADVESGSIRDHTTETLSAYAELVKEGKVRVIGNSNHSAETMRQALAISTRHHWPRFENLQTHYNLYDRSGYEAELESFCAKNEIGVTSYFSLAKGFLSGKYRSPADFSKSAARGDGMASYLNERGLRILAALDQVAKTRKSTPAQIAIAWLIARAGLVAPIASATSVEQLQDLIKATKLDLAASEIVQLTEASAY